MPKFIINYKNMNEYFNQREYQKGLDRRKFITKVNKVLTGELDETSFLTKNPDEIEQWLTEDLGDEKKKLTIENLRGVQYDDKGNVANSDFEVIVKRKNE